MAAGGRRIPSRKREAFKTPLGSIISEEQLKHIENPLITVGDVVSLTARKLGIFPDVSVYDGYTERREMTEFAELVEGEEKTVVENPAGTITCGLADTIRNALSGRTRLIRVIGEEDLAVIPFVLFHDNVNVVYGMPGKGMMLVTTSAVVKKKAEELWNMMEEFE